GGAGVALRANNPRIVVSRLVSGPNRRPRYDNEFPERGAESSDDLTQPLHRIKRSGMRRRHAQRCTETKRPDCAEDFFSLSGSQQLLHRSCTCFPQSTGTMRFGSSVLLMKTLVLPVIDRKSVV